MTTRTTAGASGVRRGPWLGGLLTLAACLAVLSILSLVRSLVAMTYLNIRYAGEVNPVRRAISYYVFVEHGRRIFAITVIVVAVATIAVLAGMVRVGVRLGAPATILFGVWCTSLTLCAIFPTDNGKAIVSTAGLVHQVAGAALFVSLPLAGLALARRLLRHEHWIRTAAIVRRLAIAAMGMAAAYLAMKLPGLPDSLNVSGFVQRVLFGLEIGILLGLSVRLLRVCVVALR